MIAASLRDLPTRLAAGSLSRNGLAALGQSLVVLVCTFLAYRLVISYAGLERFGVWSLLLAGSAVARIGDISGGGALARFVAAAGRDGPENSRDLVHTVMLTSLVLNAMLGLAVWFGAPRVLPLFIEPQYLAEAQALVPYVVASMVIGALAIAATSGIDGAQRADQRAIVVSVASLVFLVACLILVPGFGVIGFGAAQVLQQVVMMVLGWVVLRRHVPGLGWLPHRWRRAAFAETTGYAVKLNAIGVLGLIFEPLVKFAFNHTGGPALVGLYELASRLVVQVRGLVIAAATPLVPAFAAQSGTSDPAFKIMLERAMRITALAAVCATLAAIAGAPLMSIVLLGHMEPVLLTLTAALAAGWAINILTVPIYFAAQALGVLRWNIVGHAVIAASVLFGVFVLVPVLGSNGLVLAIIIGLIVSMFIILLGNAHALHVADVVRRLRSALIGASAAIAAMCLAAAALAAGLLVAP
ncbi:MULTISPECIES: lipopolysaccharide biosynthesis protein [unclassified Aurantimonas]|uniref:lipopolysaccharide biosynthesis protein n=1 Tax=unclassified Aurantimonas TaxID=2638230 RepID=UPI002E188B05|nr:MULTISPECIES: hypothetical protein [unclassified Aurantimonas]MEC5293425.1 hypothetical protein [Aurantimonas sp. C2-3-R2]MEC5414512.1 hypothetical protein [Aurantimonas sp. C2-4-R8]